MNHERVTPRLMNRRGAAEYLGASEDAVDRLINTGVVSVVRLPAARHKNGAAVSSPSRSVLVDREELDALISTWREKRGGEAQP